MVSLGIIYYMGGCQNYGPFLGTLGTIILTIPHIVSQKNILVSAIQGFGLRVSRSGFHSGPSRSLENLLWIEKL